MLSRFDSRTCIATAKLLCNMEARRATTEALSSRLARSVRPVRYELSLAPRLDIGSFTGSVRAHLDISEPRHFIYLHSNYLLIQKVRFYKKLPDDQAEVPVAKYYLIADMEYLVVEFEKAIEKGGYSLHVEFEGDLTRNIVGFYSSKQGNKTMAASKFQPTYARQAFPCFDEPDLKATYDISLVKPSSYIALSNMNEIPSTPNSVNNNTVRFATSVPMSTYLACFVVCDYLYEEETIDTDGVGEPFPLRAYARDTQEIVFALDIGKRATEFYVQYYQIPYPLPKLDMIAIPDYVSGATEHWGLITYRETSFLINEATASASNKLAVANTIAHELAHMWFGNLVTMKWWDEVWLNEGFATYMQVKALDAIEPSWTMLDQFLTTTLQPALVIDSKLSSHPIVQTVDTPDQITAIFDAISYNKGSSVLRMLEGFIGASDFQRGVTDYLQRHKFGNTVTQDLLDALEPLFLQRHPDLSLKHIMDTWTKQTGYPLVTVNHGPEPFSFLLTQTRFLADPDQQPADSSPYNDRWFIPLTYKTFQGEHSEVLWFPDTAENVRINVTNESFWIKVNTNQTGYYRVNYPQDVWLSLADQLQQQSDKLTTSDRAQLLSDAAELAAARVIPYELALRLATYLPSEQEYVPWSVAANMFGFLHTKLMNSSAQNDCEHFIQELVTPIYLNMSWDTQTDNTLIQRLLRMQILDVACSAALPDARVRARSKLLAWLDSRAVAPPSADHDIEPDLRNIIYYNGMREATPEEWERLWRIYLAEENAQERAKLLRALAAPADPVLLARYLELAWVESAVRAQDYLSVVGYVAASPAGEALAWDYVRAHWDALVRRFTLNSRYLGNLIPAVTANFRTEERLQEMEEFFAAHPAAGAGEAARERALEAVRNNVQWARRSEPAVAAWLAAAYPAPTTTSADTTPADTTPAASM